MRLFFMLILITFSLTGTGHAQRSAGRWSLGLHGGADVTDDHTLKLLGAQLGYGIRQAVRLQLAVTSVIEEPGTTVFSGLTAQWSPTRGALLPYIGGGLGMGYTEVGPFTNSEVGGLVQAGFRASLKNLTPFVEFRILGIEGTISQILIGFESRPY